MPTPPERSLSVFPAGSLGEYDLPPELAIVLRRGLGARVWDAGEREYRDFTMGWGSILLGHAHPEDVSALR
jgi:glutamate-1-semialdehyde 2,1-aminomutase